jgi:hypothetical protein
VKGRNQKREERERNEKSESKKSVDPGDSCDIDWMIHFFGWTGKNVTSVFCEEAELKMKNPTNIEEQQRDTSLILYKLQFLHQYVK